MLIKLSLETIPPFTLTAGRLLIAALILYSYMRLQGERLPKDVRSWGLFFFIGFFGNTLPFVLIGWGETELDSGLAAVLMGIMPVATALMSHLFIAGEKLNARKSFGVALGFFGLIVLIGIQALQGLGAQVIAQIAVLSAALCYAINTVFVRLFANLSAAKMSAGAAVAAVLMITPCAIIFDSPASLTPSNISLLSMILLGLLSTALANLIYFFLIRNIGAMRFAQINYMVPVMGACWGVLLLNEQPNARMLIALVLVMTGVTLVNMRSKIKPDRGSPE